MQSSLSLVTAPVNEPVTLAEAKSHLRVTVTDDDDVISASLTAARERVEIETGRQLTTATYDLRYDNVLRDWDVSASGALSPWGDIGSWSLGLGLRLVGEAAFIDVPRAPLQSVTSITYVDTAGVTQTWPSDQYQVDAPKGPTAPRGRIRPAFGVTWPVTQMVMNALTVRFVAGYGDAGTDVPQMLRRAVLMILGDLYENREATIVTDRRVTIQELPTSVSQILQQYRVRPVTRAA